jgi:hypothetical protein
MEYRKRSLSNIYDDDDQEKGHIGLSIDDKIEASQRRCCSMCYFFYQIMKTMLKI